MLPVIGVDKTWFGPDQIMDRITDWTMDGSQIGSQKKNQKNQIVYKIILNKK